MRHFMVNNTCNVFFEDDIVKNFDLFLLFKNIIHNIKNEEELMDWITNYSTYNKHEINTRCAILYSLSENINNLHNIMHIDIMRKDLKVSLVKLSRENRTLIVYMNILNALKTYKETVDMMLNVFSREDIKETYALYQEILKEKASDTYKLSMKCLNDCPDICNKLTNVTLGINMTEYGSAGQIALVAINENSKELSKGVFNGPSGHTNSLFNDVTVKLRSEIVHIENYIIDKVENNMSKSLRTAMKEINKIELANLERWCDWLKHLDWFIAGLSFMKILRENMHIFTVASFSESEINISDMQYPHLTILNKNPVPQTFNLLNGEVAIITGANSSGKTSFLKSFAQNIILAQLGFPVLAKKFMFRPFRQFTSLFATGEEKSFSASRYQQEAQKLSSIERITDSDTLCLFNEPFTSTNPKEASELISDILLKIKEKNSTQILVTHLYDIYDNISSSCDYITSYVMHSELNLNGITYAFTLQKKQPDRIGYARMLTKQYGLEVNQLLNDAQIIDKINNFLHKEEDI